eukprot:m.129119 g.129119  ORF g.129119 m.129119 type:complete len:187 (+) comp16753_c0_seq1:385-945(+)
MVVCCRVTGPVSGLICLYRLLSLQPTGVPVVGEDVIKETVSLPDLEDGQVLVKVLYFSLDPFVRGSMNKVSYGREMPYPRVCTAFGAGVVAASKNDEFPVGTKVTCMSGWQEYYVHDPKAPGSKLSAVKEGESCSVWTADRLKKESPGVATNKIKTIPFWLGMIARGQLIQHACVLFCRLAANEKC